MEVCRGDIFYIIDNYASVGSEQKAGRPAVIVSNEKNNQFCNNVTVVFLTTQEKKNLPTHTQINTTKAISTALCEGITTVSKERLGEFLCQATEEEMNRIDKCIKIALELTEGPERADDDLIEYEKRIIRLEAERDVYKDLYFGCCAN